jgi:hypothetical protein
MRTLTSCTQFKYSWLWGHTTTSASFQRVIWIRILAWQNYSEDTPQKKSLPFWAIWKTLSGLSLVHSKVCVRLCKPRSKGMQWTNGPCICITILCDKSHAIWQQYLDPWLIQSKYLSIPFLALFTSRDCNCRMKVRVVDQKPMPMIRMQIHNLLEEKVHGIWDIIFYQWKKQIVFHLHNMTKHSTAKPDTSFPDWNSLTLLPWRSLINVNPWLC